MIILEREPSKKRQRTDTNKDAKMIRNDNFTRGIYGRGGYNAARGLILREIAT